MKIAHIATLLMLLGASGCDHGSSSSSGRSDPAASAPPPPANAPAAAALALLAGFEGEIDLSAKGKTQANPIALNLLVKNEIVRVDFPPDLLDSKEAKGFTGGGKVYALLKAAEKKLTVVLDAKREAIVINLDEMGDKMKAFSPPGGRPGQDTPSTPPPKVTKTGKMETVAGYPCEDWDIVNADKSKLRTCVADQGASFFHLPITGIPTENLWALELMDGKHFPLRGIATEKDGTESGRVEVTKIDKRALDAAQFEVPAGYKQVTIDEMMQGLGGGMPPGDIPPHGAPHGEKHGGGHHHHKGQ
jgi:Domain of unknown function (DUF4412)